MRTFGSDRSPTILHRHSSRETAGGVTVTDEEEKLLKQYLNIDGQDFED